MSKLTPEQVDEQLGRLSVQLDHAARALDGDLVKIIEKHSDPEDEGAEQAAVEAREAYVMAHAQAFLTAEGPVDVRKQIALQQTHAERLAAETAERIVRGLARRLRTIQSRVDAGRTRSANVRSEANISRTGAWGA